MSLTQPFSRVKRQSCTDMAKIVGLNGKPLEGHAPKNFRDPVATLRTIANEVEAGKWGEVGCVGVVLLGDTMEVWGAGVDSEGPSTGMLLQAGALRLLKMLEGHGRE